MIFKQWQQVLDGNKTQTRRLVLPSDGLHTIGNYQGGALVKTDYYVQQENGRMRWCTYRTYAVQPGRGKKAVGRFRIIGIRRERLQDISEEDAIAEGMFKELHPIALKPVTRYMQLWDSINRKPGTRWEDDPEVWTLTFELVI